LYLLLKHCRVLYNVSKSWALASHTDMVKYHFRISSISRISVHGNFHVVEQRSTRSTDASVLSPKLLYWQPHPSFVMGWKPARSASWQLHRLLRRFAASTFQPLSFLFPALVSSASGHTRSCHSLALMPRFHVPLAQFSSLSGKFLIPMRRPRIADGVPIHYAAGSLRRAPAISRCD
jgi:hypothetical protein